MAEQRNPYAAPQARVDDRSEVAGDRNFIEGGRSVASGQGWQWIVDGWGLFKRFPGVWILMFLVYFVISVVLAVVPVVNLIGSLLFAVFTAGFMVACRAIDDGEQIELGHLFAGFRERLGSLVLVSVIVVGLAIVLAIVLAVVMIGGIASLMALGPSEMFSTGLLFMLAFLALYIPIIMAYWFAPALVILEQKSAMTAMKESFQACLKNILPFLLYGVIALVFSLIAIIPLGLGLIVLVPTLTASIYASFKDIYYDQ